MAVDRCVCHQVTFTELLRLHREEGLDLEGLQDRTGACTGCGSCEPYVRLTLRTGVVDHPVLTAGQIDQVMRTCS
ncbi:MAG: (2Fe-2S)-binding protein [Planctomycetota bacterium]